jgi:isopenicillin-N N-acyltransferase like protein
VVHFSGRAGDNARVRTVTLEGTPKVMGETFGAQFRAEIRELYKLRVANALAQAKEYGGRNVDEGTLMRVSRGCLPISEAYDREGYAELVGISTGADMTIEQIFAMNGLTDLRDVLAFGDPAEWGDRSQIEEGCSSFVIQKDLTADGKTLVGQTWDLATDNMPFVIAVQRKPKDRPSTWTMTTVGCLSLIGMNDAGIAIGTTNIRTKDSRTGVTYLQIIHRALREKTLAGVSACIVDAPRAGAHYYYAADANGGAIAVECTAARALKTEIKSGYYVHCNHVLDAAHKPLEAVGPYESSICRQSRMGELIAKEQQAGRPITVETAKAMLADHDGEKNAICRHDYAGISSNGSVIISPEARRMWTCHGPACKASWIEVG